MTKLTFKIVMFANVHYFFQIQNVCVDDTDQDTPQKQ